MFRKYSSTTKTARPVNSILLECFENVLRMFLLFLPATTTRTMVRVGWCDVQGKEERTRITFKSERVNRVSQIKNTYVRT